MYEIETLIISFRIKNKQTKETTNKKGNKN